MSCRIRRWRFPCSYAYGPQTPHQVAGRRRDPRIREPLCPSLVFRAFRPARHANALRQFFFFELQAYGIVLRPARSPSRSAMPSTKRTVAYIPIATPGSPFSILTRVVRLIEARCAAIAAGMPPPPPGVTDVAAELAQGMPYREWHYDG